MRPSPITIEIAPGEGYDRAIILDLKIRHTKTAEAADAMRAQATDIREQLYAIPVKLEVTRRVRELEELHARLWSIEDEIRRLIGLGQYDDSFICLAKTVPQLNDRRAELKRAINAALSVECRAEEKLYSAT